MHKNDYIYNMRTPLDFKTNYIIDLLVYPHKIMISINETDDELEKSLKKGKIKKGTDLSDIIPMPDSNVGRCAILTSKFIVIRIRATNDLTNNIRIAVHEIFHAVCFLLDFIGVQFDIGKSDEQYAYLIDYISGQVLPKIIEETNRLSNPGPLNINN